MCCLCGSEIGSEIGAAHTQFGWVCVACVTEYARWRIARRNYLKEWRKQEAEELTQYLINLQQKRGEQS